MESPEEDNKQVYMPNNKIEQEKNFRNVYERSEKVLNSDVEPFHRKAASLIDLWKQLSCVGSSPRIQCIIHLMDWAKLHTLNIVLSGEWKKHKEFFEAKLLVEVRNCEKELFKLNNSFSPHCKKLIKVINDPWGNTTLHRLLNAQDPVIGPEEFEFFMSESGYLVSMRLKKLCESHCEDLALNLVTAYMRCCDWAVSQNINMNLTDDQKRFMLDVYIALLYKYNKTTVILTKLKSLSLKDGLELVQRFAKKRVNISKLWKHSNHITHLASVLFCSTAVMQPIEQAGETLTSLIDVWLTLCERDENLESLILSIRKVVQVTVSAPHMYIFCQALNKKFGPRIKTFNIELYVQALTTDLNLLERQKNEDDRGNLQETSKRLADGLLQLADVLEDHVNVCRECVLTSFSLQPTKECLRRIEELARRCGYEVLDTGQWKCKLHPPISSEDDLGLQCFDCGDFMGQMQLEAALNTNTALSEALTADRLGVSPELCDDLAVLVCSPRYQLLSWLQKWPDLHRLCVMYLNDPERTKNLVTELKFLEIDYSIFMNVKREPEEDDKCGSYTCAEGVDLEYSDPNFGEPPKPKRKRGRKKKVPDIESDLLPFLAPKSDPEVLKTLRSFRRTFKRKNDSDSASPGKVFIGDNVHSEYNNYAQTYGANSNFGGCNIDNIGNYHYPGFNDYNTPYVSKYGSFSNDTDRTFSEISFHANEEVLQQGMHSQDTYYNGQENYYHYQNQRGPYKYGTQDPSTSKDNGIKIKNERLEENSSSLVDVPRNLSLNDTINNLSKKDSESVKQVAETCNSEEQLQIEEQHFSLNEFTNEITIQDSSDSSYDESENILPILAKFASTEILTRPFTDAKDVRSGTEADGATMKTDTSAEHFIFPSSRTHKFHSQKQTENSCVASDGTDDLSLVKDYSMKTLEKLHGSRKQSREALDTTSKIDKASSICKMDTLVKMKLSGKSAVKSSVTKPRSYKTKSSVEAVTKRLALKLKEAADSQSSNDTLKVKELNDDTAVSIKSTSLPKDLSIKSTSLPKDASVNQEKSLFREKFIETVFADENRKALKELVKESLSKKSEGSGNKENSRFIAKKKSSKSDKSTDTKTTDKVSPKLNKKSETNILERPKENIDKLLSKTKKCEVNSSDKIMKPKDKLNFQEAFQESLKKYRFHKDDAKNDSAISKDKEYSKRDKDDDDSSFNIPSISYVTYNKNSSQEQNNVDYTRRFNLKDLRVILHRLNVKFTIKKGEVNKNKNLNDKKLPKKAHKHKIKKDDRKAEQSDISVQLSDTNRTPPVTDKTLRVIINDNDIIKPNILANYLKSETEKLKEETSKLNPRVVLKRLELDRARYVNSILANVPGLNDTELIRPGVVDSVVQVVQIGGRQNSTVSANTQTSTQVTPHIQRIGQPRNDKPETTAESSSPTLKTTTTTNTKPATSQPSTLISMLSPQIKPGQSNNSTRNRTTPLINILSQQIIKPANTTVSPTKSTPTTTTTEAQSNSTPKIVAGEQQQIINQIMGPVRASVPSLKLGTPSESSRIVQFICQSSDGKLIPVTSFTPNRVVKVATTQTVTSSSPGSPNYDENYTKLIQTTPKSKSDVVENSDTLPKFQQAFGKSAYQNNVDNTNSTNITNNVVSNTEVDKVKAQQKSSTSLNIKPIHGGVIYTRQMPVGQTINLIPQTRAQVFRIATSNSEQISLVKDTVIHNKMSALLAAALQGKKNSEETETTADNSPGQTTRLALTRPALVQNTRIVKPVLQIPSNVIRNSPQTNLSSTTLEQLREFDMVYKQVKERSSTIPANEVAITTENSETSQRISVTYLNQGQKINCAPVVVVSSYGSLQPTASPALSVASQSSSSPCVTPVPTQTHVLPKVTPKSSKGKSVKSTAMHTSKASPIPKPQQKPQEDEHTTQRIFDILAEYAEQLRNSPDLNNKPAPRRRSNPPTNPSQNSKRKKSSSSKKTGQCSSSLSTEADVDDPRTMGSEDSSCGVMQLSMQEDEQPSTMASTSESNDSSTAPRQQLILTDSSHNQTHNLIITDSSVGEALKMPNTAVLVPGNYIMPVSMVKGGQQIAVVSGGSKILATVPARSGPNMLLFQSFLNQTRKTAVPTVKYSTIQPIAGISSQSLAGVSAQPPVILPPSSHGISTVTLGQSIAVKKLDDSDRVNTELLLTISQSRENDSASEDTPQPDSSTNIVSANIETVEIEETATLSDNSSEKAFTYRKSLITTPIATPVIAQATCNKEEITIDQAQATQTIMTLSLNTVDRSKGDSGKVEERVQSVLVTAGTSSGPMLSHSPPQYKQSDCSSTTATQNKDDFVRNIGKKNQNESKNYQGNVYALQGKAKKAPAGAQRLDRELQQLCLQRKQAALERELRLQKSLSEECEDLGVDEPSTSDLFPEAELLFDSNHSPSFDHTSQDVLKRPIQLHEGKEDAKLTLFSDDDFLFEAGEYQTAETELEYEEEQSRLLTNGQSGNTTESESPCEDNTLLQTCTSMSDVTLNSPISPDVYNTNTPPPVNKYVHKYSNKKKNERVIQVENWTAEVSSSEDTTGSTELVKSSSRSPELCLNKRSDEELSDGSFKVVHVAISKTECEEVHCTGDTDCSLSGRGARRSVKKLCSCCNGSQDDAASRKRPASQPQTPTPHKKIFPNKKR